MSIPQTALSGRSRSFHDEMARGLGWFSLALGAAELLAPRLICRAAGLDGNEALVRGYGGREIATGIAILASHDATPWVWGRVAGDAADVATVAAAAKHRTSPKTLAALGVLLAATALDAFCANGLTAEKGRRATARADYRDRSGFPHGLDSARGAARDGGAETAAARPAKRRRGAAIGQEPEIAPSSS
ncbi:MAG TPA: cyclase dehydrase [Stellaceae bacterium]|nr:cyclase dehydrase [Stellaceae bacterium]